MNTVTLHCQAGHTWERQSQRGRRPLWCPEHRPTDGAPVPVKQPDEAPEKPSMAGVIDRGLGLLHRLTKAGRLDADERSLLIDAILGLRRETGDPLDHIGIIRELSA